MNKPTIAQILKRIETDIELTKYDLQRATIRCLRNDVLGEPNSQDQARVQQLERDLRTFEFEQTHWNNQLEQSEPDEWRLDA